MFAITYPAWRDVLDWQGICLYIICGFIVIVDMHACGVCIVFEVAVGLHDLIGMCAASVLEMHIRDVYPFA